MQRKKWKYLLILFTVGIIVTGFMVTDQIQKAELQKEQLRIETEQKKALEDQIKRDAEVAAGEARKIEEAAKAKAEAEEMAIETARIKREDIEKNTYYVKLGGTNLLSEASASSKVIKKIPAKTGLYASDYIKNEAGETVYLAVKENAETSDVIGYVASSSMIDSLTSFIENPFDDADYTPQVKNESFESNPKIDVKGIFVTGNTAQSDRMDEMIALIDETALNAIVIDVKDDVGYLLFPSVAAAKYNPNANDKVYIDDIKAFVAKLKEHDIYLIARIVAFKSPFYALNHPDRAIVYKDSGKLYTDSDRLPWVSPHDRIMWEYNVEIAKEAADLGFNEIQFDYVRFPAIGNPEAIDYRNETDESQSATIQNFLKYAYEELKSYEVYVSADVFGWAATATGGIGIGQHWEAVSNVVDYISPMMYPSHYGPNTFGLPVPDAYPYETIDRSVKDAINRNKNLYTPAGIRPWIQDFTATWVEGYIPYRTREVKAQIDALRDNGINEYLVWNAGNYYRKNAFIE
jgi:hypothetical protein